ncbi:MAG: alkaline phosphatase D family protein [Acidimicrobiales bacterium]
MDRRRFLQTSAGGAAVAALWPFGMSRAGSGTTNTPDSPAGIPLGVAFDPAPFSLGVASGDPLADAVILWTRLAPSPLAGDGPLPETVEVSWTIALDPDLNLVVRQGTTAAVVRSAHSVHVDVDGLEPATTYYYRFSALGATSRLGRARTAPIGSVDHLRFAFVSCQDFQAGSYASYRALAGEDLDFVLHLGDYIYEYAADPGAYRSHIGGETTTLDDYRNRYALYKGDPALRDAHAAFTWICTWDDHEVVNNYAGTSPPGAPAGPEFDARRANGYQAWYEHLPVRLPGGAQASAGSFPIHRRFQLGDLLDLSVLDTRQYRSDQPCGDATGNCAGSLDPNATMLGAHQEAWLLDNLSTSTAAWRGVAQQVMMAQLKLGGLPDRFRLPEALGGLRQAGEGITVNHDQWDGYATPRRRLLSHLADNAIPDVVVLTGDIHSHWVADLKVDFDAHLSPVVATEFVGSSITSTGFPKGSNLAMQSLVPLTNPHIRFVEGERHGYAIADVTPERWETTFRTVGDISNPTSPVADLAGFRVMRGRPRAIRVR